MTLVWKRPWCLSMFINKSCFLSIQLWVLQLLPPLLHYLFLHSYVYPRIPGIVTILCIPNVFSLPVRYILSAQHLCKHIFLLFMQGFLNTLRVQESLWITGLKRDLKNVKFWWMLISTPETSIHNMHLFYQLGSAEPRMKIIFEETAIFMLTSLSFQQITCTILY